MQYSSKRLPDEDVQVAIKIKEVDHQKEDGLEAEAVDTKDDQEAGTDASTVDSSFDSDSEQVLLSTLNATTKTADLATAVLKFHHRDALAKPLTRHLPRLPP
ncbi:hypothetical protein Q9L58_010259 [Maublancomyces gigas]|uniref:Uncharacterized protein n=1 Tax=Discina gigas TaxID=1032678 RepID=A0ABR3G4L1_9PEZI